MIKTVSFCHFEDVDVGAEREMEKVVLGIYAGRQREGAEATDPLEDVGILIEGFFGAARPQRCGKWLRSPVWLDLLFKLELSQGPAIHF